MTIRAVIFDLGDTLFPLGPLLLDMQHRLHARMVDNKAGRNVQALALAAAMAVQRARDEADQASTTVEVDLHATITSALAGLGADVASECCDALIDEYGAVDIERFLPLPDCATRVATFRQRDLKIGLVSNTSTRPARMERYLDSIGLLEQLDHRVYSCVLGIRKPHPDIYRAALDGLGVQPHAAIFVGDRLREDVAGPQAIGMRAVLTHEFRQDPPDGVTQPLAIIRALPELHAVLDGLA